MDFWNNFWAAWNAVWAFFTSFPGSSIVLNVVVALWGFTGVVWLLRRKNTRLTMGMFIFPIVLYGFGSLIVLALQFLTDPGPVGFLSGLYNVLALVCFIWSLINFIIVWLRKDKS